MEFFWKKLEEELLTKISDTDKRIIISIGVTEFLIRDIRLWKVGGYLYNKDSEKFIQTLLREIAKTHFRTKEGV